MTEEDCVKRLQEAETRALDFLARFPGLVVLSGVQRLADHLEKELRARTKAAEILGRLRAFVEGRNTLANLREVEDRRPLRYFSVELNRALPDGLPGQEAALQLLQAWLAVAGDAQTQEAHLAELAERHEAWLRGFGGPDPLRGIFPHAP
jgi:hypothetical protein